MEDGVQTYPRQRICHVSAAAEKIAPESKILSDTERSFQRVLMSDIVGLLSDAELCIPTVKNELALAFPHETGKNTEKGRLAGSVRAGDRQHLAAIYREVQVAKDLPASPDTA
jgi:hypothetical protein